MKRDTSQQGFTLTELMIALVITGTVLSSVIGFFTLQKRIAYQEELSATVDASLRVGLSRISDTLRNAGYGVPTASLVDWVPWVTGFDTNPYVRDGASGTPDALDIALCRTDSASTLKSKAAANSTKLVVSDPGNFDAGNRRLVFIGDRQAAHVTSASSATLSIDTDPTIAGAQGLARTYFGGTPLCRVDVVSFDVDPYARQLRMNAYDGNGPTSLVDDIIDLQIETLVPGREYRITLTAESGSPSPDTGAPISRDASTKVTLRQ